MMQHFREQMSNKTQGNFKRKVEWTEPWDPGKESDIFKTQSHTVNVKMQYGGQMT